MHDQQTLVHSTNPNPSPILSGEAVDPGIVVRVSKQFMLGMANLLQNDRPQFRKEEANLDLDSSFQVLHSHKPWPK